MRETTILDRYRYYANLSDDSFKARYSGTSRFESYSRPIGPCIVEVVISQTREIETGKEFTPTYRVHIDGESAFGGPAHFFDPEHPEAGSVLNSFGTVTPIEVPASELLATKVALRGPIPNGGSYYSTLDDLAIDRLISDGWKINRIWQVWQTSAGIRISREVSS